MAMAAVTASNSVNAQENLSTASKLYSVGPAIEFSGGGTSFGIKGKFSNPGTPISFRPIVLFGYTPSVNKANFSQVTVNGVSFSQALLSSTGSSFTTLTTEQKRAQVKSIFDSTLTDSQADDIAQRLSTTIQTGTIGFTPGSGTAYGAAVTYDFESADKKFGGYIGPRVLFANGTSKIGNFDTSTSETSVGLLVGADYAISADFTAGLSATYNFSKSGTFSVTSPAGFSGSTPVSGGGGLDIGINFGYRF
jgi:Opacity family porin protein